MSRGAILLSVLLLVAVALVACKGDPGAGTGGPSSNQEESFALPTPTYPLRTVEFIVGDVEGSSAGEFAEAMAAAYTTELPGDTNVLYQPGNSGVTALEGYRDIDPDGHTMLVITESMLAAVAGGLTDVDATRTYLPVILGVFEPYLILSDGDFADWEAVAAAAQSGSVSIASTGPDVGLEKVSIDKLAADLGIRLDRVVINDETQRLGAPAAGTADLVIASISSVNAVVPAGDLTPILALWPERIPGFDTVPTALESGSSFAGLPGLEGVALHRRTPQFLVDRIQQTLRRAKASTSYQVWLTENGLSALEFPSGDPGVTLREQIPAYAELLGE